MTDIKRCIECGYKFDLDTGAEGYGAVLDHFARDHNDSEAFWRVIGPAKTWTRCGACGEMFVSEIKAGQDSLTVDLYCGDCDVPPIKTLLVEDVTGRYVVENEAKEGCA